MKIIKMILIFVAIQGFLAIMRKKKWSLSKEYGEECDTTNRCKGKLMCSDKGICVGDEGVPRLPFSHFLGTSMVVTDIRYRINKNFTI